MPTVLAPAKLTVSLRMTGLRDDGYHLIDAEMVSLGLHDTLEIDEGGSGLEIVGPAGSEHLGPDSDNLVLLCRRHHRGVHRDTPIPQRD